MGRSNRRSTTRSSTGRTPRNSTSSATSINSSNHNFGGGTGNNATNSSSKASSGAGNINNNTGGGFGAYNPYDVTPRRFRSNNRTQRQPARKWIEVDIEIAPGLYNTRYVPVSSLSEEQLQKALEKRSRKDQEFQSKFSSGVEINIIEDPPVIKQPEKDEEIQDANNQQPKTENDEKPKIELVENPTQPDVQQINNEQSIDKTKGAAVNDNDQVDIVPTTTDEKVGDLVVSESTNNEQLEDTVMAEAENDQAEIQIEQQPKGEQFVADPIIGIEQDGTGETIYYQEDDVEVTIGKETNQEHVEVVIEQQPKVEKDDDPVQHRKDELDNKAVEQQPIKEPVEEPVLDEQATREQPSASCISQQADEDQVTQHTVVPPSIESKPLPLVDINVDEITPASVENQVVASNSTDNPNQDSAIELPLNDQLVSSEGAQEIDTEPPAKRPKIE